MRPQMKVSPTPSSRNGPIFFMSFIPINLHNTLVHSDAKGARRIWACEASASAAVSVVNPFSDN